MLGDRSGLMRKMWAAHPFQQRRRGQPNCWDRKRDARNTWQDPEQYFTETFAGFWCGSNWYEGNPGQLGNMHYRPSFTADAPALLGFDETIDSFCASRDAANPNGGAGGNWHAGHCIAANLNILSLYGNRVPYNICCNLEWQVCASLGKLPGQTSPQILFSKAPSELDPGPSSAKPFGQCRGWRDAEGSCEGAYATDSIFFLEVCVFNQICANSDELWTLAAGQPFTCNLNRSRFDALQQMLIEEPDWGPPSGLLPPCEAWCNKWTCEADPCSGCGAPMHAHRNLGCK